MTSMGTMSFSQIISDEVISEGGHMLGFINCLLTGCSATIWGYNGTKKGDLCLVLKLVALNLVVRESKVKRVRHTTIR